MRSLAVLAWTVGDEVVPRIFARGPPAPGCCDVAGGRIALASQHDNAPRAVRVE